MYLMQQEDLRGKTVKANDVLTCMVNENRLINCLIIVTNDNGIYMLGAGNYDLSKDKQSLNTFLSQYQKAVFLQTSEVRDFLKNSGITDNEINLIITPILAQQKELCQQIYSIETDISKKQTKLAALKNQADMD